MTKHCSNCAQPAACSIMFVLTSVGISPREQRSSHVVLFCKDCLRELAEAECWATDELRNAVNNVYTELNLHSATKVNDAQQDSEELTRKQRKKGASGDR
jgi:hypothetical protein